MLQNRKLLRKARLNYEKNSKDNIPHSRTLCCLCHMPCDLEIRKLIYTSIENKLGHRIAGSRGRSGFLIFRAKFSWGWNTVSYN